MSLFKRVFASAMAICALTLSCLFLAGCGEPVAATYDGGQITEDQINQTVQNMQYQYIIQYREQYPDLTDEELWDKFVKERLYESDSSSSQTAVEKAASQAPNAKKDEDTREPGTLEDMRAYIAEQLIRTQLVQDEIDRRRLEVTDEEVEIYVEQQRQYIESRYMEGVFESVLQLQGYRDLDEYREEIREQLKQLKLQNEVSELAEQDGEEVSGKAAWNVWFENLYDNAHVTINPAPSDLPYATVDVPEANEGDTEEDME